MTLSSVGFGIRKALCFNFCLCVPIYFVYSFFIVFRVSFSFLFLFFLFDTYLYVFCVTSLRWIFFLRVLRKRDTSFFLNFFLVLDGFYEIYFCVFLNLFINFFYGVTLRTCMRRDTLPSVLTTLHTKYICVFLWYTILCALIVRLGLLSLGGLRLGDIVLSFSDLPQDGHH